ncbi:DUF5906 domain-containing protein [Reichenbachiella sp.]|uniref:DUF5906 domain-containing protein n=1 Tax=Reichenbachiella sp. TaxID=2184521 RepID=UPI003299D4EE
MTLNTKSPYLRIGTQYYKKVIAPVLKGSIKRIIPWSYEAIKTDHSNHKQLEIEQYDGFCNIPSHTDHQEKVKTFYNVYHPLSTKPRKMDIPNFHKVMKHVFEEQLDLGFDYLALMFQYPTERLNILCLVSKAKNSGKSTFLALIKLIFESNAIVISDDDFRSNFNASWLSKLLIAAEEIQLNRDSDSNKLKNLSTAKTVTLEAKGKDRIEVEFFGKFILCSNHELDFVKIDEDETRYWVRKLKRIPKLEDDSLMTENLRDELPGILFFLNKWVIKSPRSSRMWFDPKDLETEALIDVKAFWNKIEVDELIKQCFKQPKHDEESIFMTASDISKALKKKYNQTHSEVWVGKAMKRCHWERCQRSVNGQQRWGYLVTYLLGCNHE